MVAAAVVGSVVGAGANIVAGNKAAKATKKASQKAADVTLQTARENNDLQRQIYDQNRDTLLPFVQTGASATRAIQALLGLGGDQAAAATAFDNYRKSTGYDFRVQQGQKAVLSGFGARGYLENGAANKAALRFGQGVASQEFNNFLGTLQGQQEIGLKAASAQAGVGQGYAGAVGANNTNAANAAAQAALTQGNATANNAFNTANAINGALSNAVSAYSFNQALGSSYGGGINTGGFGGPIGAGTYGGYDPGLFGPLGAGGR